MRHLGPVYRLEPTCLWPLLSDRRPWRERHLDMRWEGVTKHEDGWARRDTAWGLQYRYQLSSFGPVYRSIFIHLRPPVGEVRTGMSGVPSGVGVRHVGAFRQCLIQCTRCKQNRIFPTAALQNAWRDCMLSSGKVFSVPFSGQNQIYGKCGL